MGPKASSGYDTLDSEKKAHRGQIFSRIVREAGPYEKMVHVYEFACEM